MEVEILPFFSSHLNRGDWLVLCTSRFNPAESPVPFLWVTEWLQVWYVVRKEDTFLAHAGNQTLTLNNITAV